MPSRVESMMYAGAVPWHGIGVPVGSEVRATDAIKLAGLDWKVGLEPVFAGDPPVQERVQRALATVRLSDQKPFGIVGDRYRPVQNEDAFSFFDEVVGRGEAGYHTAGALDGGRKIWILAKLPGQIGIGAASDTVEKYVLLMNSHDGSTALRMLMTPIRVVCANTLNIALQRGAREGIAIRHTASATARIEEARRALGLADEYFGRFSDEAHRLVESPFSDKAMKTLAETLLPGSNGEVSTRTKNSRDRIVELFSGGRGHEQIRGTAWAALNAVAEFVDHVRVTRSADPSVQAEKRLASSWLGSGAALKRLAHQEILYQLAA